MTIQYNFNCPIIAKNNQLSDFVVEVIKPFNSISNFYSNNELQLKLYLIILEIETGTKTIVLQLIFREILSFVFF